MTEQDFKLVPGKEHYAAGYVRGGRIFSYAHQMNAVLEYEPQTVLEVGPGPGMVTAGLRAVGVAVTTVDVQPELSPDIVASVVDLPFEDGSFDVAVCCQVLEHLPLDQFVPALRELDRVSSRALVISLPDCTPHYETVMRLPKLGSVHHTFSRPYTPTPEYRESRMQRDGHYWEIGYPESKLEGVKALALEAGLRARSAWRVREMPHHHFIVLEHESA